MGSKVWRKSSRTTLHSLCTHPYGRNFSLKLSLNLIKHHTKKVDGEAEAWLHINITKTLDAGK
jgi:hypothetical protein